MILSGRMARFTMGLATLLTVTACGPPPLPGDAGSPLPDPVTDPNAPVFAPAEPGPVGGPPPGAVDLGNETYAVPVDVVQGCTRYRLWSPTRMTAAALVYLDRNGSTTLSRDQCAR